MPGIPGVRILSSRAVLRTAWLVLLALVPVTSSAEQQATLGPGLFVTGNVAGEKPEKLVFVTSRGKSLPLRAVKQVVFPRTVRMPTVSGPLRTLALWGGERLTGDLARWESTGAEWVAWEKRHALGVASLAGVLQPAPAITQLYEDFESASGRWDGGMTGAALDEAHHGSGKSSLLVRGLRQPITWPISEALSAGRIELSFYDDSPAGAASSVSTALVVFDLLFKTRQQQELVRVTLGSADDFYHIAAVSADAVPARTTPPLVQMAEQPLRRQPGWRYLRVLFEPGRLLAFVDDNVLGTGTLSAGDLVELRITTQPVKRASAPGNAAPEGAGPAPAPLWIDDLKIVRTVRMLPDPMPPRQQDLLWLLEGEELFGDVVTADRSQVVFKGAFGTRSFPWGTVRGVLFRDRTPTARPIQGLISRLEFAPGLDSKTAHPDLLEGALISSTADELVFDHPYLGRLQIPSREVERLAPVFQGRSWMIEPGLQHLGDGIREDFTIKLPGGHTFSRTWSMNSVPKGTYHVSLRASDLEPSGPGAPADGPFRDELAKGHLTTELMVNGVRVSDLNRHAALRAPPGNPLRIRVPIAAKLLKAGENTIRLEQRPARSDPSEYDECEISRLALEWEE